MGQTIAEKIFAEHVGRAVPAGHYVVTPVDVCLTQDTTGPLAVRVLQQADMEVVKNPERTVLFMDHAAPSPRRELSNDHIALRKFAHKTGAQLCDIEVGVCHQVIAEQQVRPGDILVGADSHSCTAGALGAFGTGMGSTDVAMAIALGKTWMRVPHTIRVNVTGELRPGVLSKDVILHLIGLITADGATYKALEFGGPVIAEMSQDDRLTISNMAVEAGAKAGLMATDEHTREFLSRYGRGDQFRPIAPDPDAVYEQTITVDGSDLVPIVSFPHTVDNIRRIDQIREEVPIQQVFLGSCTNGRLNDLTIFARLVKGHKRNRDTRVIVTPASADVYRRAIKAGIIEQLVDFGASVNTPGCGPCLGVHQGVLGDNEACLSTTNRNFKGRMGNPTGLIFLGSPATAAATAIEGRIADPRRYLG